ncbi:phage/plasmid primase, P4 family [Halomonas sp. PGE1]|uniref:phage/plasmid primase, P4 family n=1 Tax=Halomonas sp. PGE1 TaxID=2730360 RepID=UPI0014747A3B|nr:phage/plasmid primase, P4 family [Halomonas sp. PGE1]QJQ98913.1 hypothetical protein HIR79_09555 [Halomonas sp. PGE1]
MGNLHDYIESGRRIFPLWPIVGNKCGCGRHECKDVGKHPRITGWQNSPHWSDEQIDNMETAGQFETGFGVVIDDQLVIDVDPRNGGEASYAKLVKDTGIDFKAESGHVVATGGGGWHIEFTRPSGSDLKGMLKGYPGIDFKSSGFVVGASSMHKSGLAYESEKGNPCDLTPCPPELLALLKVEAKPPSGKGDYPPATAGRIREVLKWIPNEDLEYEDGEGPTYMGIMMAVHDETEGEGYELFSEWSEHSGKHDSATDWRKWQSLGRRSGITFGSVMKWARDNGMPADAGIERASYDDVLTQAQALGKDTAPEEIEAVVEAAATLKPIQKRRVHEVIKRQTGLPFSAMAAAERATVEDDDVDDLALAQGLADEVGRDNVIAAHAFVWRWMNTGVWQKQEDRSIKQWAQHYMAGKVESVRKNTVDSVVDLFKTEVFKPHHEFDVGPVECVNTLNGELVLEVGNWHLVPHDREHYRTTQIPVAYDPEAKAPQFEKFMMDVFNGDPDAKEKREAVLEMIGYSLMAHCRHERFIILVGSGANGKSVLLSVLEGLLGSPNVAGVQPSQFDRSFQRAHLFGKLANIVTEIKQGEMIDDASLKGIVSGEPTTVEHKFKDPFDMRPFSTCWFGTNHMPHTRDFSDALFRRAMVVEFNNTFKPELGNCDPQLKDKLLEELPGILNLALCAYAEALLFGFTMPSSCQAARDRWRLEADQVAQFVEAECQPEEGGRIPPQRLFNAYKSWADDNGIHKKLTQRSFLDRLKVLGYESRKSNGVRNVQGLKCERIFSEFVGA